MFIPNYIHYSIILIKNMQKIRKTHNIRSSLKTSTIEGSWWAVMYGSVETYFGAFFEFLKYSSYEISILSTLPLFIGSIFQNYTNIFPFIKIKKTLIGHPLN